MRPVTRSSPFTKRAVAVLVQVLGIADHWRLNMWLTPASTFEGAALVAGRVFEQVGAGRLVSWALRSSSRNGRLGCQVHARWCRGWSGAGGRRATMKVDAPIHGSIAARRACGATGFEQLVFHRDASCLDAREVEVLSGRIQS